MKKSTSTTKRAPMVKTHAARVLSLLERGTSLYMKGRLRAAEEAFTEVFDADPNNIAACAWAARCAADGGRHEQALALWRRAVQLDPRDPQHRNGAAIALRKLGRSREAITEYLEALAHAPAVASLHANLGTLFFDLNMFGEALQCFDTALVLDPSLAPAHANRGQALRRLDRSEEAESAFRVSLALDARQPDAWNGLGTVAFDRLSFDEAQAAFSRAASLAPDHPDAVCNLGSVLSRQGRFKEAIGRFERALSTRPDALNAQWGLSLAALTLGDFERGWRMHEARLGLPELVSKFTLANEVFAQVPRWNGASLKDRSITLLPEQGFGDLIQFHRFAQRLVREGAKAVNVVTPAPLVRLMQAQTDGVNIVPEGTTVPRTDYAELLMSMPYRVRFNPLETPDPASYLVAPREAVESWRAKLDEIAPRNNGLRVALVWAGRPTHPNDGLRSIVWGALAPLLAIDGVRLVSLQKGGPERAIDQSTKVVNLGPQLNDFADTAAVLTQCDLLI
ncbi:MAG TPA: tetratricopeptide repeat protein, partial [Burkholderiaceae bacterium]|nr:tetratricopeptide repeat protein [Burkholderiaceae bacterium]